MVRPFLSRALVGSAPPHTAALQGLRVLFNFAVVCGHVHSFASLMLDKPLSIGEVDPNASAFALFRLLVLNLGMWASVDVFLLLSGFFCADALAHLAGDAAARPLEHSRPTLGLAVRHLLGRFLRLAPLHALVAAAGALRGDSNCVRWHELLFASNWFYPWDRAPVPRDACVTVGWSLAVDFQAHALIAALLAAAPSWATAGAALTAATAACGLYRVLTWVAAGVPRWVGTVAMDWARDEAHKWEMARRMRMAPGALAVGDPALLARRRLVFDHTPWYFAPRHRVGPALLGAALWIAMRRNAAVVQRVRSAPHLSLGFVVVTWVLVLAGVIAFFTDTPTTWASVLFVGAGRIAVAVAMAVIVILTSYKDDEVESKPVSIVRALRGFLGNKVLVCLSRQSYAVYLSHILLAPCISNMWPVLQKTNYTLTNVQINGVKWFVVSTLASVPLCLFEEACLSLRRKLLLFASTSRSGERKRLASNDKKEI